jgi:hypothetical protein
MQQIIFSLQAYILVKFVIVRKEHVSRHSIALHFQLSLQIKACHKIGANFDENQSNSAQPL